MEWKALPRLDSWKQRILMNSYETVVDVLVVLKPYRNKDGKWSEPDPKSTKINELWIQSQRKEKQ